MAECLLRLLNIAREFVQHGRRVSQDVKTMSVRAALCLQAIHQRIKHAHAKAGRVERVAHRIGEDKIFILVELRLRMVGPKSDQQRFRQLELAPTGWPVTPGPTNTRGADSAWRGSRDRDLRASFEGAAL